MELGTGWEGQTEVWNESWGQIGDPFSLYVQHTHTYAGWSKWLSAAHSAYYTQTPNTAPILVLYSILLFVSLATTCDGQGPGLNQFWTTASTVTVNAQSIFVEWK